MNEIDHCFWMCSKKKLTVSVLYVFNLKLTRPKERIDFWLRAV